MLKPCPFCGSRPAERQATYRGGTLYTVGCSAPACQAGPPGQTSAEAARDRWNSRPPPPAAGAQRRRAEFAEESFQSASRALGPARRGMAVFCVTRGQFSLIDAILHCAAACDPGFRLSVWTWRLGQYDIDTMLRTHAGDGLLIVDRAMAPDTNRKVSGARAADRLTASVGRWIDRYGHRSVSYLRTHAKIATVSGSGGNFLIRGSMSCNHNSRFEQMDVTEGGPDYELVRHIEDTLPRYDYRESFADMAHGTKIRTDQGIMPVFHNLSHWSRD